MGNEAIDPSEIIIEKSGSAREDLIHANPWSRLIARFFDYGWFFLLLLCVRLLLGKSSAFSFGESFIPTEYFAWIPVEGAFLTLWGKTPGKFFMNIHLRQGRKERLDFRTALKRSFNVWLRGLGMMIPLINGFCLLVAYHRLKTFQTTSWDRDDYIRVSHVPIPRWRVVICAGFAAISLFLYFHLKNGF